MVEQTVEIPAPPVRLAGDLSIPPAPTSLIIFAHCGGSSRMSSRKRQVASILNERGLATLLLDLLTPGEEAEPAVAADVDLLSDRLLATTRWAMANPGTKGLPIAYFGSSTGTAAALCAAAELGDGISAVVSRGGRPDTACDCLERVTAPTLLMVAADGPLQTLNEEAAERLSCPHELRVLAGATHLFDEPGAPDRVAGLAAAWLASPVPYLQTVREAPTRSRVPSDSRSVAGSGGLLVASESG